MLCFVRKGLYINTNRQYLKIVIFHKNSRTLYPIISILEIITPATFDVFMNIILPLRKCLRYLFSDSFYSPSDVCRYTNS